MTLKQTRKVLRLSLRDAGWVVGVSGERFRQVESGEQAGEQSIANIRAAYRAEALALISMLAATVR